MKPRTAREALLLCAGILIPALMVAFLGARALVNEWRDCRGSEQEELDSHAAFYLGMMLGFADDMTRLDLASGCSRANPQPHSPPRPPSAVPVSIAKRPPNAPPMPWTREKLALLPGVCEKVAALGVDAMTTTAFEIADETGRRLFASANWPEKPAMQGSVELAPPLGDGAIRTARADGGVAFRARLRRIATLGAIVLVLLVAAPLSTCAYLFHLLHHERRDAQSKIDFFDNVSHELKTPLAGIRLNAELLSQGRIADEKRRKGALDAIMIEADRLYGIVERLLDFRRLNKGSYRFSPVPFNLAEFVDSAPEREAIAAISRGRANVNVKFPGDVVLADPNALRHIGANLVSNAVKYSDGPIDIEVEGTQIRYKDRGPGIPGEAQKHIFERFYRVDNSITQKAGGIGIGLPIARLLARGMGGDVTYSCREGGGSVFTVSLKPFQQDCQKCRAFF